MIDYTTVEVIKGALIYAAEEMGISLKKSAYSPNIKERMDHSCALFSHNRELIAQAEHIPVHLGSMALAIKLGLEEYEGELRRSSMTEGSLGTLPTRLTIRTSVGRRLGAWRLTPLSSTRRA